MNKTNILDRAQYYLLLKSNTEKILVIKLFRTLKEILSFDLQTSLVNQLSSQEDSKEDLIKRDSAVRAELEGKNTDDWDSVCLMQSDSSSQKYSFDLQESMHFLR